MGFCQSLNLANFLVFSDPSHTTHDIHDFQQAVYFRMNRLLHSIKLKRVSKQIMTQDAPSPKISDVVLKPLNRFGDDRGWLIELYREDELSESIHPVMAYISQTLPGIVRGPHEHHDQTDYFAFIGPSDFELTLWDARSESPTFGVKTRDIYGESNPFAVSIPPGVVHAYKNIGTQPGWVFNGPNSLYAGWGKKEPVDEIRHELDENSQYHVDADKNNAA